MATANEQLRDLLLRRLTAQVRYERGTIRELDRLWRALGQQLAQVVRAYWPAKVQVQTVIPSAQRQAYDVLSRYTAGVLGSTVGQMQATLGGDLRAFGHQELIELPQQLQQVVDHVAEKALREDADFSELGVVFSSVPVQQAAELLASTLGGSFYFELLNDLGAEALRSVRGVLLAGLMRGQSVSTVSRLLQTTLQNKRWQSTRIVRSEYVRVAAQAALLTYEQNKRYLRGVQWVSTLDDRTCVQCGVLDGQVWREPLQAKLPVLSTHPNCRCALVPVLLSARELGLQDTPGVRASFSGEVAGTETYATWFNQQSPAFQRGVLGPRRYALYQAGQLQLRDFVGPRGVRRIRDLPRAA